MKRLLNLSRFKEVVSALSSANVMVVGDLMLDEFVWGEVERISPEAPVPVVWVREETSMPGGAANVARNISSLGGNAILCGVVGKDHYARRLLSLLKKEGVDIREVITSSSRPTTVKTRIVAHNQQVVRIDREEVLDLSDAEESQLLDNIFARLDDVSAVIIEDYGKGVISQSFLSKLIPEVHRRGKIVTVDPKRDHFTFYKGADVITPNRKELSEAVGRKLVSMEEVDEAARQLMRKLSLKGLLVTLSEEGMKLYTRGSAVHIPTAAREVFDVSGAGDTVIATFTMARCIGADPVEAAVLSNVAAGVVVGKVGVAVCSVEELVSHFGEIYEEVAV